MVKSTCSSTILVSVVVNMGAKLLGLVRSISNRIWSDIKAETSLIMLGVSTFRMFWAPLSLYAANQQQGEG